MKLNIGCSEDNILPGYINIDKFAMTPGSICADAMYLPFKSNCVDMVYASHFLEHLKYEDIELALKEWWRVLKPYCLVEIIVPNMNVIAREWLTATVHEKKCWWVHAVLGSRARPGQFHKSLLDEDILRELLMKCGFLPRMSCHDKEHNFWLKITAEKIL